MSDFVSVAFQSSLGTQAILFGVFGLLYTVYGVYSANVTPANPQRAPIVQRLRLVCRIIVGLVAFNAVLTICSIIFMYLSDFISGLGNIILSSGFIVIIIAIVVITAILALRYME